MLSDMTLLGGNKVRAGGAGCQVGMTQAVASKACPSNKRLTFGLVKMSNLGLIPFIATL
jgi:hypothetical protein